MKTEAPWWIAAFGGLAIISWIGLVGFAWSDYDNETAVAAKSLIAGDVTGFISQIPAYGGSLILRLPFAGAIAALGGGDLAVYRAFAIPCLVALGLLAIVVVRHMGTRADNVLARGLVMGLFVVNPLTVRALEIGHPEELLCAVFAISAVLTATRGKTVLAAVLLGLAIATKAWAVLAIGPVLLALPGRRILALAIAGTLSILVVAPMWLVGSPASIVANTSTTGTIFTPFQVFWFLGDSGQVVLNIHGVPKPDGWRVPPQWLSPLTHPLIALLTVPLSLVWAWVHRAARPNGEQVLLLLALLFLLRCVLDPWNSVYYELPLLLTLLTWEALTHPQRLPYGALALSAVVWVTFETGRDWLTPDMMSVLFLLWALPLTAWLARAVFRPAGSRAPARVAADPARPAVAAAPPM